MPLFLVTCVCDEGIGQSSFRVIEAESRIALAGYILRFPYRWSTYLERSHLWDEVRDGRRTPTGFLEKIDSSSIDGDSRFQLAIHEISCIENCSPPPEPTSFVANRTNEDP